MRTLIREIEGDGNVVTKKRLLTFKEFCQYVYEPSRVISSLDISNDEKLELEKIIEERKFTPRT